ncbi:hypothetical protein [Pseudothauera nasutitermitis]|uniref:hypothetical protein n=1 Tax=Pseudothauera nasutitermitis TaxID=2565930 RepID=UPI001E2D27EE|nr:hypothetical protein [Pseudothauera nasutitermitis]
MLLLLCLPLLLGCERMADLLELPDPQKETEIAESEGRAIGGACRHAGRSLEDCYALNPDAVKAAVFAGWRDMNDYMMEHKLQDVPSHFVLPPGSAVIGPAGSVAHGEETPKITPGTPFTPIQPPKP